MTDLATPSPTSAPTRGADRPERILAVGAHPDDIDFVAGGTLALWVSQGAAVTYCVITDGDAGGHDRSVARESVAGLRRREQREAAAAIGVTDVVFLGYQDGALAVSPELRRDLARVIRRVRPEVIICQSPERNWWGRVQANHPDHLAAGEATLCAVYPDARNPFAFPELMADGLEPYHVGAVWLAHSAHPDRAVDVTGSVEGKVEALARHVSQMDRGVEGMRRSVYKDAARAAQRFGLGEGKLAEAFQVVVTEEVE